MDDNLHKELLQNLKEGIKFAKREDAKASVYAVLSAADIKAIRSKVQMSQTEFARSFHLSLNTLKGWEQGKRKPDYAASNYLRLIQKDPAFVQENIAT